MKNRAMKKIILLFIVATLWSCNDNNENKTDSPNDSLATNPHAVPSHVDTITHEDGSNQSQVNSDTATSKDTVTKDRNDTLPPR